MFGFTRKTDYALVALATLAQHSAEGDRAPMSARRIADEARLPGPLLMQLLQSLHKAGILASTRGVGGGYAFQRPADRVSVLAVIEAIEGPVRVVACCDELAHEGGPQPCQPCDLMRRCPITGALRTLNHRIADYLDSVSISDLLHMDGRLSAARLNVADDLASNERQKVRS